MNSRPRRQAAAVVAQRILQAMYLEAQQKPWFCARCVEWVCHHRALFRYEGDCTVVFCPGCGKAIGAIGDIAVS